NSAIASPTRPVGTLGATRSSAATSDPACPYDRTVPKTAPGITPSSPGNLSQCPSPNASPSRLHQLATRYLFYEARLSCSHSAFFDVATSRPVACPSRSRLAAEPKRMLQATSAAVPELTRPYVVSAFAFSVGISLLVVREMVNEVPKHVAIIMDGNGRWARQRGWPRSRGHLEGAK